MNIKGEWRDVSGLQHNLYVGESKWGVASREVSGLDLWQAGCYLTREWKHDIPTLDEAKAWVEEQARAWLAEVSREQRLLTLANAFSEAYAKAMADQGNTQSWLKVHEAWCAYDDAQKEVMG